MLEKGTMTFNFRVFPKCHSYGTTQTCWTDTCEPEPCLSHKRGKTLQNAEQLLMARGQGGCHSQCTASCFPGSVAAASVIRWFSWTSFPLAWEEPRGILSFMGSGPLDCGRVTSTHIHCQRGASFLALFISAAEQ